MRFSRLISLTFLVVGLSLWTLAPYGGCSCANALAPNSGPPPTPTPDHGPKIDDMEHPGSLSDNFNDSIQTVADNVAMPPDVAAPPSTLSHNSTINSANSVIVAGGSNLAGGTPGYAACVSGYIGHDNPPYPYAQLIFGLGGSSPNISVYAPNRSLKFSFKANASSVNKQFFVNFTDSVITDFGWYRYQFSPTTTNWTAYTVYFPDAPIANTPRFAQAAFGACKKWYSGSVCGGPAQTNYVEDHLLTVIFQPVPSAASRLPYDFCVDDVTFN